MRKEYIDENGNSIFGRMSSCHAVMVLYSDTGENVTRLDEDVYPVRSPFSARHEHPHGIVLSLADAEEIGLPIEN